MSLSHAYGPDGNLNVTNNGLTEARPVADRAVLLDEIDEGTVGVPNGDGSTQRAALLSPAAICRPRSQNVKTKTTRLRRRSIRWTRFSPPA